MATRSARASERYLALLFLGAIAERTGELAEAEARYRSAVGEFKWGQSGPLALARLLSRTNREREARDVVAAIEELGAIDHVSLMTFNSGVHLRAGWTSSPQRVRDALQLAEAGGATSLYDAAFAALIDEDAASGNRQLILLFSDGNDTSSWLPPSAVIERARRSEAVVYTVALGGHSQSSLLFRRSGVELLEPLVPRSVITPFLTDLSNTTGGASLVASLDGLQRMFARVVGEFRTRYVLTYTPRGVETDGWHPIEVKLKNRKGKVSARRSYLR